MQRINEEIKVNSFYFPNGLTRRVLPRTIELGSSRYIFTDGLRYLIRKGDLVVKLFDMTDGKQNYRLRQESDKWTLVSIKPAV